MIVNQQSLDAIFYNFRLLYGEAFKAVTPIYKDLCTEVSSSTREERYPWLASIKGLEEWIGPRTFQNLSSRSYSIVNKHFQQAVEVNRDDIEDDQIGLYSTSVKMLAEEAAVHPDILVHQVIESGTTATGYDGVPFWSDAHPVSLDNAGLGTYSNRFDSATSGARALNAGNFAFVRAQLLKMKRENGQPMVRGKLTLLVPPALETTAAQILNSEIMAPGSAFGSISTAGGSTNVLRGTADLIVSPYLTSDTRWYVLATQSVMKPFIFQNRKAPEFVSLINPGDPSVFSRNAFQFGVDYRAAAGFGVPQLAATADV